MTMLKSSQPAQFNKWTSARRRLNCKTVVFISNRGSRPPETSVQVSAHGLASGLLLTVPDWWEAVARGSLMAFYKSSSGNAFSTDQRILQIMPWPKCELALILLIQLPQFKPQLPAFRRCNSMNDTAETWLDLSAVTQMRAAELSQSHNPCSEIRKWTNLLD